MPPVALRHLDDGDGLHPLDVGVKAARLAAARAAGLPALPGFAVPLEAADGMVRRCAAALQTGGSGAARLEAMDAPLDGALARQLERAGRALGGRLVVRSSSVLEAGAIWSGAFTSYLDVRVEDLPTAVRGVWASAFSREPLERCEQAGVSPRQLRLGVLVQPHLEAEAGGVATVDGAGRVEVVWVAGSPAPLLGGWEPGRRQVVDPRGHLPASLPDVDARLLRAVAGVALATGDALGANRIEWAVEGGRVVLLQADERDPQGAASPALAHPAGEAVLRHEVLQRLVRLLTRYPGRLAERLLLPWAAAADAVLAVPGAPAARDVPAALREAATLAGGLVSQAWELPADRAGELARRTLGELAGADAARAAARLAALRPVDAATARRVVTLVTSAGRRLAAAGVLPAPGDVWRCHLEALLAGDPEPLGAVTSRRAPPSPWEPLVYGVVAASGRRLRGAGVVGGSGAGRACLLGGGTAPPRMGLREVMVAARPLPQLASLLWNAAGLVTLAGGRGSHLLDIALALNVPTVTGCRLEEAVDGDSATLLAVDGDSGVVTAMAG